LLAALLPELTALLLSGILLCLLHASLQLPFVPSFPITPTQTPTTRTFPPIGIVAPPLINTALESTPLPSTPPLSSSSDSSPVGFSFHSPSSSESHSSDNDSDASSLFDVEDRAGDFVVGEDSDEEEGEEGDKLSSDQLAEKKGMHARELDADDQVSVVPVRPSFFWLFPLLSLLRS
jgi:hypothetical protein